MLFWSLRGILSIFLIISRLILIFYVLVIEFETNLFL